MEPLLLPIAVIALAALWVGGMRSRRAQTLPSGYWPLAWCCMVGVALWDSLGPGPIGIDPIRHGPSALFPFLMLAGAYQYAGRPIPGWLLPLGLSYAALRIAAHGFGFGEPLAWIEFPLVLGLLGASAWLVARSESGSPILRRLVALGMGALAVVEGRDIALGLSGSPEVGIDLEIWAVVGVTCAALQLIATLDRLRWHAERYSLELRDRNEYLQAVLESVEGTRVVLLDPSGRAREILGGVRDEGSDERRFKSMDLTFRDRIDDATWAQFVEAFREVRDSGSTRSFDIRFDRRGQLAVFGVEMTPVLGPDGRTKEVVAVTHDLTQRLQALEALRVSEERMRVLIAALNFNPGMVVLDRDGRIVELIGRGVGEGEPDPRGLRAADTDGRSITDFLTDSDADELLGAVRDVFIKNQSVELQEVVELPNGRRHFDVSLRPLHSADGDVESVLAVCTDVTERVESAQERLSFEQRSLEAQKLESLGILSGGIAHDFNNLLSGIVGNAELALEESGGAGSSLRALLDDIHRAGERGAELTRQLLAYAGKAHVARTRVHLPTLVEEMSRLLRASLPSGVRLEIETLSDDTWVEGDVTQIRQLVMNLMTNAAEAVRGEAGLVAIRMSERSVEAGEYELPAPASTEALPAGRYVELTVRDDGIGMDEATRSRIFEPFFTTKFEGRGLGLAAAVGVVRGHGGSLRVDSLPGGGTTFEVLLPRAEPEQSVEAPPPEEREVERQGTILVVDDDDGVRRVAERMLIRDGYRVFSAGTRDQALALFDEHSSVLDAALVDLTMPDCSGLDLANELKARARGADFPVLFMSGHSAEDTEGSVSRLRPFVQKPFSRRQLGEALGELLPN